MSGDILPELKQQALFAVAHTNIKGSPFNNHGRTMRLVVESNAYASEISVLFSNLCGEGPLVVGAASLAKCDAHGVQAHSATVPLTVAGVLDFTLLPGEEIFSDRVAFPLVPGEHFALNLYYPSDEPVTSGNWAGNISYRSRPGNYIAELSLGKPRLVNRLARTVMVADMTVPITTVRRIVAHTERPGAVLGCFGDSITQQAAWTAPLQKLLHRMYPGEISLCNLGISGNRLLRDACEEEPVFGAAGMKRFMYDLAELEGLTHAIIGLGTNDIGHPGTHGIPESELPFLEDYAAGMTSLADRLHLQGVQVYASTLCPRAITGAYTEQREAMRLVFNEWIRNAPCFDAVLDFDAWMRRADGTPGMRDKYHLPDGLHPSQFGGLCVAKSIDLELFRPGKAGGADG